MQTIPKEHHPYHLYLDDTIYFLTSSIYQSQHLLNTSAKKQLVFESIRQYFTKYCFKLYAWVILDNHYHIEFKTRIGRDLQKALQFIHGGCSFKINGWDNKRGRKIFQNYWDHCIRDAKDFYNHFNYIHQNPVKHGYVKNIEDYPFSSYQYWSKKKGVEWIKSLYREYPILDFTVEQDECF